MTQAGDLRKRIQILEPQDSKNNNGGVHRTYAIVPGCDSVPCSITYPPPAKKGDEAESQQQLQASVFATIKLRYRPTQNISPAMIVRYGNREFEIRTVNVDEERLQWVTLQCEELQAKGTLHA
jgi:head-tail adaptor